MRRVPFVLAALLMVLFSLHACSIRSAGHGGGGAGDTGGAESVEIFSNDNVDPVQSGPTADTKFTIDQSYRVTSVRTYHWNGGSGTETVGTITLLDGEGVEVGTWACSGSSGQGGVPNAYWECRPDVEIGPGTYSVIDSDPDTWSRNAGSGNAGICVVMGIAIGGCAETCIFARDGECDDGGPGSTTDLCTYGTDCTDCGPRMNGAPDDGFGQGPVEPESTDPTPVRSGVDTELDLADGTKVVLPALTATDGGTLTELTLERAVSDQDLSSFGQESAASMRVLRFDSFNPTSLGFNVSDVVPYITIPAEDVAGIDEDTITVARISDIYRDGNLVQGQTTFLPVHRDDAGNLVVTDFMFPDSIFSDLDYTSREAAKSPQQRSAIAVHPREIRYVAGTFRGSLDWRADPVLQRMVPSSAAQEQRTLFTSLGDAEQESENQKSISNVIVLIHGHNEEEKTGLDATLQSTGDPWYYSYKRDVWTNLCRYINEKQPALTNCTAFYEFIYPTYRPIFTPTGRGERLDQALAHVLDETLAQFADANPNLNLYFVAHSMGGLVARAGIQLMGTKMQSAFRGLATWGTPHMGSPLVTLRYVLAGPPSVYRAGPPGVVTFPLDNIDHTLFALRRAVENLQVDSPGTRDMRWARSHTTTPRDLNLERLFTLGEGGSGDDALLTQYALDNGTWLYNGNLRELNTHDLYSLSSKIHALYGVTSKRAEIQTSWFLGIPNLEGGDTAKGALVMPWLMDNPTGTFNGHLIGDSDGAAPVVSLAGAGVAGDHRDLGDIDHEEYFGAPVTPGAFTELGHAETTASTTLSVLGIQACPEAGQRTFTISGTKTLTGDDLSGWNGDPVEEIPFTGQPQTFCGGRPENARFSYSATVVVSYDGVVEPTLSESTEYPDVYDVFIYGYRDPITMSGSVSVDVTPTSSDVSIYHFEIVNQGYSYSPTTVGNTSNAPNIVQSGSGFSWTFTSEGDWEPAFGPWDVVLTYERTYDDGSPVTTQCSIDGIPSVFYLKFHLR